MNYLFVSEFPSEASPTSVNKNKKKKPNIFLLYRNENMKFRPHKMPMQDFMRIVSDKWYGLSESEKDRLRASYEISRDTEDQNNNNVEEINENDSRNFCVMCGKESSEGICNSCINQLYQGSNYNYGHCELCSSFSGCSKICIFCYEQFAVQQRFDYPIFGENSIQEINPIQLYPGEGESPEEVLLLSDILHEDFIG
jgi:hypothetical protein